MNPTELKYIAKPASLVSTYWGGLIRLSQWPARNLIRLGIRCMPHTILIQLEPGDLRPGSCYVIASNHQSMFDPFIICSALPLPLWLRLRSFRFFAHNGLFESLLTRYTMLALGSFPASSHSRYAYGIEAAVTFLSHGQTVVIFPQGRRMDERGRARSGVKVLADLPNVAVIPARVEWQRHGRWRRSFRLTIGKPIKERGLSAEQILNRIYELPV